MRVGCGFDVHAFGPGNALMLGGVRVAHTHGVIAHSDGDVPLHALCDALLGAAGLLATSVSTSSDTDSAVARRRQRASSPRCSRAARPRAHGGQCGPHAHQQAPKLAPHRDAMRQRIAQLLGIEVARQPQGYDDRGPGFSGAWRGSPRRPSCCCAKIPPVAAELKGAPGGAGAAACARRTRAQAELRVVPEDFCVERTSASSRPAAARTCCSCAVNANTQWVARELARLRRLPRCRGSVMALVRRTGRAVAVQWFSVPLPRVAREWGAVQEPEFSVLAAHAHTRKSRRAAHWPVIASPSAPRGRPVGTGAQLGRRSRRPWRRSSAKGYRIISGRSASAAMAQTSSGSEPSLRA
jgi:2-C-methyl-D-erythritol 2,4-cyclodiphosphate synthase